jgi:hypothetical protein
VKRPEEEAGHRLLNLVQRTAIGRLRLRLVSVIE